MFVRVLHHRYSSLRICGRLIVSPFGYRIQGKMKDILIHPNFGNGHLLALSSLRFIFFARSGSFSPNIHGLRYLTSSQFKFRIIFIDF